jgi:flagellar assembly factor FliW
VKVKSTRFGEMEIDPGSIIDFPSGLPGFEKCIRFQLFHEEKDQPMLFWLQSLDEPDVAFSVVDPTAFGLNYQMTLSDDETKLLDAKDATEIAVMMVLYNPLVEEGGELKQSTGVSANINGPVLLNVRSKRGMQKVILPATGMVSVATGS